MSARDPYAMHALLLVYGEDRSSIARQLRDHADRIDRGSSDYITQGAEGVRMVRDARGLLEEAGTCRMFAVIADGEGACASDTIAMFADEEQAKRFLNNLPPYEPEDASNCDKCAVRADCIMSVWNSYDPDPIAPEAP